MAARKQQSAREQFASLDDVYEQRRERIRQQLAENMSENLERIGRGLAQMLQDEFRLNKSYNNLDPKKLKAFYFEGRELDRVSHLRLSPVTFEIGLSPYGKAEIERMPGFEKLVQACASDAVDMNIIVRGCPEYACQIIEVRFDKPFDVNGPYKDMIAKPAAAKPAARKPS